MRKQELEMIKFRQNSFSENFFNGACKQTNEKFFHKKMNEKIFIRFSKKIFFAPINNLFVSINAIFLLIFIETKIMIDYWNENKFFSFVASLDDFFHSIFFILDRIKKA